MDEEFEYQQMLAGELYLASSILPANRSMPGKMLAQKINQLPIENRAEIVAQERKLFGKAGDNFYVKPPLSVCYGNHVEVGDNFYANLDCIFLDINKIVIGDNVLVGPRVNFYTAGHPTDAAVRATGLEFGHQILVENNVWIGGSVTILPGVTIGENSIVGAGAVVTKDVPKNTIVGGNPAGVIREISAQDHQFWQEKLAKYRQLHVN